MIGFAWAAFIRYMHGFLFAAPFPSDGQFLNELGNLYWYWQYRTSYMFGVPQEYAITGRIGEQVRLWAWAVPGLPIVAAAGWWLGRQRIHLTLLGLELPRHAVADVGVELDGEQTPVDRAGRRRLQQLLQQEPRPACAREFPVRSVKSS